MIDSNIKISPSNKHLNINTIKYNSSKKILASLEDSKKSQSDENLTENLRLSKGSKNSKSLFQNSNEEESDNLKLNFNEFLNKKSSEKEKPIFAIPTNEQIFAKNTNTSDNSPNGSPMNFVRKSSKISDSDKRRLTTIVSADLIKEKLKLKITDNNDLEELLIDIDEKPSEVINPNRLSLDYPSQYSGRKVNKKLTSGINKTKYIKSFFSKSQAGKDETGSTKINQDSFMVLNKILKLEHFYIFGVFDGHGTNGHLVSGGINRFFNHVFNSFDNYMKYPSSRSGNRYNSSGKKADFQNQRSYASSMDSRMIKEEFVYDKLKENNYELIKKSFQDAENELISSNFDVNLSGSTCVIVFMIKDKIICANVGDSRAILVGITNKYQSEGMKTS